MNRLFPLDDYNWLEHITTVGLNDRQIPCLDMESELLFMIYHLALGHSFAGLKWMVDICMLLKAYGDDLNWKYINSAVQNQNLRRTIGICLEFAKDMLGADFLNQDMRALLQAGRYRKKALASMLFEDGNSIAVKVRGKFLKATFSESCTDKLKVINYYLFDRYLITVGKGLLKAV